MRRLLLLAMLVAGCSRQDSGQLVARLADPSQGREAADELERRDDPEVEAALLAGLRSPSPSVRAHCIRLLVEKNPPQFAAEIERSLLDEHVAVSREAARALVKLQGDEELLGLVTDAGRPVAVRALVAHQMCAQGVPVARLQQSWLADPATPLALRVEAAGWLADNQRAKKLLRAILTGQNQPPELRAAARCGLGLPRNARMIDNERSRQPVEHYRPGDKLMVTCTASCFKGDTLQAHWRGPGLVRDDRFVCDRDFPSFYFWQEPDPAGWPVGAYSVEVWINRQRADGCTVAFRVQTP